MNKRIYVAGPYSGAGGEDTALNIRNALYAGNKILARGDIPFIPHLYHFWHLIYPKFRAEWIGLGKEWVKPCDKVHRIVGYSEGSDEDCEYARKLGKGVELYDAGGNLIE